MDLNLFIFKVTVLNDEHEYLTSIITYLLGFSKKICTLYRTQRRSQNALKVTHVKGRLLDQAMILFYCVLFKQELLLKEKICSQRSKLFPL